MRPSAQNVRAQMRNKLRREPKGIEVVSMSFSQALIGSPINSV